MKMNASVEEFLAMEFIYIVTLSTNSQDVLTTSVLCAVYSMLEQKQVNRVGKYIILQYEFYKLLNVHSN